MTKRQIPWTYQQNAAWSHATVFVSAKITPLTKSFVQGDFTPHYMPVCRISPVDDRGGREDSSPGRWVLLSHATLSASFRVFHTSTFPQNGHITESGMYGEPVYAWFARPTCRHTHSLKHRTSAKIGASARSWPRSQRRGRGTRFGGSRVAPVGCARGPAWRRGVSK